MHEYSIVDSLLKIVEENAQQRGAKKVVKIELKIGVLSGVEPELLFRAFELFREGTLAEEAELVIHHQPVVVQCQNCGKESVLGERPRYRCPQCNSPNLKIVDGEEMYLTSLELEIEETKSEMEGNRKRN
jgi:hydrogenase nickel incorporation protein HypA/HybF